MAADSIEGDSGYVRLRVGTDIETISTKPVTVNEHIYQKRKQNDLNITELREGYKQMLEEKRQLLNKNEAEKKEEELIEGLIIEACFTGYFSEIGYWQGDVLVKKDGCDDANQCETPMSFPSFNLIENSSQDVCNNRTSLKSYFSPLLENAIRNFDIDVCFNSDLGFWEFSFTNNNNLFIDCLLDICDSNINNMLEILIDDVHNFPTNWGCTRVKSDLRKHITYGLTQPNSHTLRSILLAHENEHKKDFEELLDRASSIYENTLFSIRKPCEEFIDEPAAKAYFLNLSNKIITNAYVSAFDGFVELGGAPGSQKELDYEDRTNAKIYPFIINLIDIAEMIYCQQP